MQYDVETWKLGRKRVNGLLTQEVEFWRRTGVQIKNGENSEREK